MIDERKLKIKEQYDVDVFFPSLNKQQYLEDYMSQVREALPITRYEKCTVIKEVEVTDERFDYISRHLFDDLDIWEEIGGSYSDDPRIKDLNWRDMVSNPEYLQIFRNTAKTHVVKLTRPETSDVLPHSIFVNTEGFKYARYVGFSKSYCRAQHNLQS